jgi:hypothetical protein
VRITSNWPDSQLVRRREQREGVAEQQSNGRVRTLLTATPFFERLRRRREEHALHGAQRRTKRSHASSRTQGSSSDEGEKEERNASAVDGGEDVDDVRANEIAQDDTTQAGDSSSGSGGGAKRLSLFESSEEKDDDDGHTGNGIGSRRALYRRRGRRHHHDDDGEDEPLVRSSRSRRKRKRTRPVPAAVVLPAGDGRSPSTTVDPVRHRISKLGHRHLVPSCDVFIEYSFKSSWSNMFVASNEKNRVMADATDKRHSSGEGHSASMLFLIPVYASSSNGPIQLHK